MRAMRLRERGLQWLKANWPAVVDDMFASAGVSEMREPDPVQRSLNNHMRNMALWGVSVIKPDGHVDALTAEQAEALQRQPHPTADALFGIFGMRRVEVRVENQRTPSSPSAGTGPAHCQSTPKDEGAPKAQ